MRMAARHELTEKSANDEGRKRERGSEDGEKEKGAREV